MSKLIRMAKGKEETIEEGDYKKLIARMKQLKTSTMRGVSGRGGKKYAVQYKVIK